MKTIIHTPAMHDPDTHPLRSDPFRIYIRTKATKYIREKMTLYFRGRTIKSHNQHIIIHQDTKSARLIAVGKRTFNHIVSITLLRCRWPYSIYMLKKLARLLLTKFTFKIKNNLIKVNMFCVFAFQYSWHPKIVKTSRKLAL